MKKLITAVLLLSTVCTLTFAAQKKANNVKLDVKKKFEIEGVQLGTITWDGALVNEKGEVTWNQQKDNEWSETGWALKGVDLSQYGGIRVELDSKQKIDNMYVLISNNNGDKNCLFPFSNDCIAYAFINGAGSSWRDEGMEMPDPSLGFDIKISGDFKKYKKTLIKSVELIKKENIPDTSNLDLLGIHFGTSCWNTHILGNEITWPKGSSDGNAGWNLEGIDLSEYDRVRIELESSDATGLHISFNERDGKNYHTFNNQVEKNVFEVDLSGEGYSYKNEDAGTPDKSKGYSIDIRTWNEKPRTKEQKTVVKSIQLLKDKGKPNEKLKLLGADFGSSSGNAYISDGGKIEWILPKKNWDACAGWRVKGIDFTGYEKIRIELDPESAKLPYEIRVGQEGCDLGYDAISSTVLEANLDGTGYSWCYPDGAKWDSAKGVEKIEIRLWWQKSGVKNQKSIVKSVSLLKAGEGTQQPDRLVLNGAKLGSRKWPNTSWLDEDFAINWAKGNYSECGWRFEKLEGDILEIKVTSTEIPLNLKIRDNKKNEAEWTDDGSHLFRIDLKTKKMLRATGGKKDPNWTSQTKSFDFSEGGEVIFVPTNGVSKEGKKTVVEYVKVE